MDPHDRKTTPGVVNGNWDSLVVVARVARTHGLRGEVILDPETDFPEERFGPGQRVLLNDAGRVRTLTLSALRFHKGRPIVAFEEIPSIDEAEPLAGHELRIDPAELVELPPGAFYHHDLVGCRVETVEGVPVGLVTRIDGGGGATRLLIERASGDVLVPLVDEICRVIDPAAKRIVIAPPDGLLELNVAGEPRFNADGRRRTWRGGRR